MFKPPYAAAITAVLITLSGGPFGLGEAHAKAIYTGTFDPQDDNYEWSGTHRFEVSEACLSSNGWREANTGYGGYSYELTQGPYTNGYDGYTGAYNDNICEAKLLSGSLSLRRKTGPDQTFKTLNFGSFPNFYVWGVYIKDGQLAGIDSYLTGSFRFNGADEDVLFGPGYFFDGGLALRWESGKAPLSQLPIDLFSGVVGSGNTYLQSFVDPVYLYAARCAECNRVEVTPGQSARDVRFIPEAVPEPGSIALVGVALAAAAGLSRRRRNGG